MTLRHRQLAVLGLLYVCEGLPWGFQATALPAYLRSAGLSLTAIGFSGALALPWLLKPLWAPWVDAYGSRRSWILPLQAALGLVALLGALTPPEEALLVLLALVFLMNLIAATLDVAVDGLAVDILPDEALGTGNAAQVVGYKVGMLGGGGILVYASAHVGWPGLFLGMAAIPLLALVVTIPLVPSETLPRRERPKSGLWVLQTLARSAFSGPGARGVLLLAGTYKLGETLTDVMWKPYLIDVGYAPAELGVLVGIFGLVFSLGGSLAGGVWASRVGSAPALAHTAFLRIFPLCLLAGLASARTLGLEVSRASLEAATLAEAFFGGALTTAMFAFMMRHVDRRIGASHFTLLAAVEVLGKAPAGLASGALADVLGYSPVFVLGAALSIAFSVALPRLALPEGARGAQERLTSTAATVPLEELHANPGPD